MTEQILLLNSLIGIGTLIMEVAIFILFWLFIYLKMDRSSAVEKLRPITKFIENIFGSLEKAVLIKIFILSLLASVIGLIYSDYFGMIPCGLCWFGRIFTYGVVVISGTALWSGLRPEKLPEMKGIMKYIINFSFFGILVSIYHYTLQMTATLTTHLPCPASGGDCAKRAIFEYGHITFPFMQLLLFVLFILTILIVREINKNK